MAKARKNPSKKVIKPGQEIISSRADNLRKALYKTSEEGVKDLFLDFAEVKTVDPVGLAVIIAAHNTLKNAGGKLTLINVSDEFFNLFRTMQLDRHVELQQIAKTPSR
ncbi:MAG: STAS domain-containing protein [Pseudomonadota bacterium]|uniref:STAS domain-containing protein n=1 Tax=Candidatus Desulfatibia profunda TaxID=2841695 RepID=A0A8J6NW76_9BACT|nr:STAS domain-containing protein [Candidatus Desulfatibia profunda]MBL7179904.1 STAS domain-containing protein [Desulfobacterales bacterium]